MSESTTESYQRKVEEVVEIVSESNWETLPVNLPELEGDGKQFLNLIEGVVAQVKTNKDDQDRGYAALFNAHTTYNAIVLGPGESPKTPLKAGDYFFTWAWGRPEGDKENKEYFTGLEASLKGNTVDFHLKDGTKKINFGALAKDWNTLVEGQGPFTLNWENLRKLRENLETEVEYRTIGYAPTLTVTPTLCLRVDEKGKVEGYVPTYLDAEHGTVYAEIAIKTAMRDRGLIPSSFSRT